MTSKGIYREVASMEPMLVGGQHPRLAELSKSIFVGSGRLSSLLVSDYTRGSVAAVVREMNSYYSNLIEGHKTLPRDIERAMKEDYLSDHDGRTNQCLATAHIRVEAEMERRLREEPELDVHSQEFLCWIHRAFYESLPEELHVSHTQSGREYRIQPGELRVFNVDVGAHTPPDHKAIPVFLRRFAEVYGDPRIVATDSLATIAAAHHRLAWIHPFGDGNGRVARLYSHAALIRQKVDASGLWTLSRGLARFRTQYYKCLSAADRTRQDDYDGRGNLSASGLTDFCVFFLETVLDQIHFMGELLELSGLLARIENYVYREAGDITRHKDHLCRLLKAVAVEGRITRGRVAGITGLKPSAARMVTGLGLQKGLLATTSAKGQISIAFPAKVLESYFPRLFLDLSPGDR